MQKNSIFLEVFIICFIHLFNFLLSIPSLNLCSCVGCNVTPFVSHATLTL